MRKTPLVLITAIILSCSAFAQDQVFPKTLLWSVEGNGLKQPSYLFGTMHLQDKRLFRFPDSLYYFLEHTNGYYMEIDAQEAATMMVEEMTNPDSTALLSAMMDEETFGKYAGKLEKEFGVPAGKITKKQLWMHNLLKQSQGAKKDMPVAMDVWLYNIAKRQGKQVGGIENISDQFTLLSTLYSNPVTLGVDNNDEDKIEKFIRIYMDADLNRITEWMVAMDTADRKITLDDRNIKMARAIDSLAIRSSSFFAVGAAHLPGTAGLINLLRSYGYTVRPVFSKKKISASDYHYDQLSLPWITIADKDSTYTVQMPAKASDFKMYGDMLPMKGVADVGTGVFYFSAQAAASNRSEGDSFMLRTAKGMGQELEHLKRMDYKGHNTYEFYLRKAGYYYQCRVIDNGNGVIMLMAGAEQKSTLESSVADVDRFLNSLIIKKQLPELASGAEWYELNDKENAATVKFPGKPEVVPLLDAQMKKELGENWQSVNRVYVDNRTGIYYMYFNRRTAKGFYVQSVKRVFDEIKNTSENNGRYAALVFDSGLYHSLPAIWMKATDLTTGMKMKMMQVVRDNQIIGLLMMGDEQKLSDSLRQLYFNSLQLLPYTQQGWSVQSVSAAGFHALAPAPFQITDTTDSESSSTSYTSYDPSANVTYYVQVQKLSRYFWTNNDSAFIDQQANLYVLPGDTVLSERKIMNGPLQGKEIIKEKEGVASRYRVIRNAENVYLVNVTASHSFIENETNGFFNSFEIEKIQKPEHVAVSKAKQLVDDIFSADSVIADEANDYMPSAPFTAEDLPLLHAALLEKGNTYSDEKWSRSYWNVIDRIARLSDSASVHFIEQNLSTLYDKGLSIPTATLLAKIKTKESYSLLKHLLPHIKKSASFPALTYALQDSLALTKDLFPELFYLMNDSILMPVFVPVINSLIDSNLFTISALDAQRNSYIHNLENVLYKEIAQDDAEFNGWQYRPWIKLLQKFKTTDAVNLLNKLQASRSKSVSYIATTIALDNNQPPLKSAISKFAADDYYRKDIYNALKEKGKQSLFPAEWLSQKAIFQSILYNNLSEDYTIIKLEYAGEQLRMNGGEKQRFYLFKVYLEDEDPVLGIVGGLPVKDRDPSSEPPYSGIAEGTFNTAQINEQLDAFLLSRED